MKQYKLLAEHWINGIQKFAGDTVHMVEAEAKYLKHKLEEVAAEAAPAVKRLVGAPAKPAPAGPQGVAVVEASSNDNASH
jgi:hypothetical protein